MGVCPRHDAPEGAICDAMDLVVSAPTVKLVVMKFFISDTSGCLVREPRLWFEVVAYQLSMWDRYVVMLPVASAFLRLPLGSM